jgi:hypothetical protein
MATHPACGCVRGHRKSAIKVWVLRTGMNIITRHRDALAIHADIRQQEGRSKRDNCALV